MAPEKYTPGWTATAVDFMRRRTIASHAPFLLPHLREGLDVLDAGCGPGTITREIAAVVSPGAVTGVDLSIDQAQASGPIAGNVLFVEGSAYRLPVPDTSVDVVLAHALLEHLARPAGAVAEFRRVLRPGGLAVLCSPDWGGFMLTPPSSTVDAAVDTYTATQRANGGDPNAGRTLGALLTAAGFHDVEMSARYECYEEPGLIAEYLATQLDGYADQRPDSDDLRAAAATLREWSGADGAMFAQAWVSAVGRR